MLGLACALACQTSPKSAPGAASRFPSESELSKLPPPPAADQLGLVEADDIDAWTLTGPFPERIEVVPHTPATPLEGLLADAVSSRAGLAVASEAMHCAAHEAGLFLLERKRPPPVSLIDFMASRCGAVGGGFRQAWYQGDVASSVSDEELIARWKPEVEKLVSRSLSGGAVAAGLWFGRSGSRAVMSLLSTQRRVLVTPVSPVVVDDRLAISGEAIQPVEEIFAHVNQGRLGYAKCELDRSVALPRFTVSCPLAPGDSSAIAEVAMREPGRMLGISAMRVLARRPQESALRWQRAAREASRPAASPGDFAEQVSVALGRVRASAELRPLGLSLPQSEQANELAPYVFAGSLGTGSPALADLAVLGLFAGWQVGGVVKDAMIASDMSSTSLDAARWLATALERPSARAALLDPDARVLAVGSLASQDPPISAAVAVTYQVFGEENLPAEATRFF